MITVKFYGYSDVEEYIENTKVDVVDSFQMYYPDSECETKIIKEEEQFEFVLVENGQVQRILMKTL